MLSKTFNMETIAGFFAEDDGIQTEDVGYKLIQSKSYGLIKLGDYFYDASDLQYIIQQLVTFEKQINAGK